MPGGHAVPDGYTVRDWEPDGPVLVKMNVAGIVVLVASLVGYGAIWAAATGASEATFGGWDLLIAVVATFAMMVVHEGVHGVAVAVFGGKPVFGATMVGQVMPAYYCTSIGTRFTKTQFLAIALAPAVVLGVGAALAIVALPSSGWIVVPAAFHLGGCVGDFAMALIVARLPAGTLVEDRKSGMRLYLPAGEAVPESA